MIDIQVKLIIISNIYDDKKTSVAVNLITNEKNKICIPYVYYSGNAAEDARQLFFTLTNISQAWTPFIKSIGFIEGSKLYLTYGIVLPERVTLPTYFQWEEIIPLVKSDKLSKDDLNILNKIIRSF